MNVTTMTLQNRDDEIAVVFVLLTTLYVHSKFNDNDVYDGEGKTVTNLTDISVPTSCRV